MRGPSEQLVSDIRAGTSMQDKHSDEQPLGTCLDLSWVSGVINKCLAETLKTSILFTSEIKFVSIFTYR